MADHKEEIEKIFKEVYLSHGFDKLLSFDDYVGNLFKNVGISYEAISAALERGIARGETLEGQLEWARNYFRENAPPLTE